MGGDWGRWGGIVTDWEGGTYGRVERVWVCLRVPACLIACLLSAILLC